MPSDADGDESGGRRRSSRRTKARAVDFTSMLEDEDEDDPGAADSDASRGLMDPAAGDESGDDWKPPANGVSRLSVHFESGTSYHGMTLEL